MLNIEKNNKVLNLLNIELTKRDTKYYLINHNNGEIVKFNSIEGINNYSFIKDEIGYNLNMNDKELKINTMNGSNFVFNDKEFFYYVPDNNTTFNKEAIYLTDGSLSFYEKYKLDEGIESFGIRSSYKNGKFYYLKKSEDFTLERTIKRDYITIEKDGLTETTHMIRNYNDKGAQITGSLQREEIDEPTSDYIENQIKNHFIVNSLMTKIDNIIPGIRELLNTKYKQLDLVNSNNKNNIKSKQK
jgi:hypothetical protein